ncbi:MAG: hypothetical protein ACI4QN_02590 [Candidatus Coproplasma sp.]
MTEKYAEPYTPFLWKDASKTRKAQNSPNPISLQRYEQEQEPAALATGVYNDVNDRAKTQRRRTIAKYI